MNPSLYSKMRCHTSRFIDLHDCLRASMSVPVTALNSSAVCLGFVPLELNFRAHFTLYGHTLSIQHSPLRCRANGHYFPINFSLPQIRAWHINEAFPKSFGVVSNINLVKSPWKVFVKRWQNLEGD